MKSLDIAFRDKDTTNQRALYVSFEGRQHACADTQAACRLPGAMRYRLSAGTSNL